MEMTRLQTFTFRVSDDERELIEAIADKLDRNPSDAMRVILRQVGASLGLASNSNGAARIKVEKINVKFETVDELPY
jgi:hypothetical protein